MPTNASNFNFASATVPDGALFVESDEPLLVYPSVEAAERDLEAIDVENGTYPAAYGAHGEPYRVRSDSMTVTIERTGEPNRPAALKALLSNYLEACGGVVETTASLDDLVAEVWATEHNFWRASDSKRVGFRVAFWGCVAFGLLLTAILFLEFR